MSCHSRKFVSTILVFSMTFLFLTPQVWAANDHVVKGAELHQALLAASQARIANMAKIQRVFATETARKALRTTGMDPVKIEKAVPLLDNEELGRLAARAEKIQNDVAAGALSNQEITYILIALGTAVLILVIVVA